MKGATAVTKRWIDIPQDLRPRFTDESTRYHMAGQG